MGKACSAQWRWSTGRVGLRGRNCALLCYIILVYTVSQRHVHLYLRMHDQQVPGNKGDTAMPTAAVVSALFSSVALEQIQEQKRQANLSPLNVGF
jgi:hypothetical protein